jgi:hypothetical protein
MTSPRVRPSRVAFLLALVFTAAAVMLPAAWLGRLRDAFPWFSRAISQVERLWPAVDMVHVLIFAALGALAALAFPRARAIVLFGALVAVAAVSELVQFRIPGRTPRLEDFLLDVAAAALALVVVRVAVAGVRRLRGGAGE